MKNKNGFTLLELLIAGTIISALVVFATISYRATQADARIAAGKAKTETLAGAMQRFQLEFPQAQLGEGNAFSLSSAACPSWGSRATDLSATVLASCGFLESGSLRDEFVDIILCGKSTSSQAKCGGLNGAVGACMTGKNSNSKVPARYRWVNSQADSYWYCVKATGEHLPEHFRS